MKELIALMDQVQTSGAFSVGGTLPSILPGLHVNGVGPIGLPLTEHQAKALIQVSELAPYGRGEETIVDPEVRRSWQLSADDFELGNPQWNEALRAAVDQIGKELGLSDCQIAFEPYKLLVYEGGSFFASHRDTEKIPNMFATLVVNLPSAHEGGELIISHAGQSQRYSLADSSLFEPRFVAFYADCYHEVKPITSGCRLCVVYNLAIANRRSCTPSLRIIPLSPTPVKMSPFHYRGRGHRYDSAPCLLPTRDPGTLLVMHHAALHLAKPRPGGTAATRPTRVPPVQAETVPGTPTLRGPHATSLLRGVCTRRQPYRATPFKTTRPHATDQPASPCDLHLDAVLPPCRL